MPNEHRAARIVAIVIGIGVVLVVLTFIVALLIT